MDAGRVESEQRGERRIGRQQAPGGVDGGDPAGRVKFLPDSPASSERVRAQLDAQVDPLTKAHTAERFFEYVDERLALESPAHTGVALVVLPALGQINEIFGRSTGDELLMGVAERLARVGDGFAAHALGRLGGRRLARCVGSCP